MHITLPKGNTFFVFCAIFIILIAGCPTPVDIATPPGTMVAPTLTAGNGQLTVAWTEPTDGGSAITAYHLRHSADGGTNWSDIINVAASATSSIIPELSNGTPYSVQVRAVNARGEGKWSESSAEAVPVAVPMAPTGLALTVGNGKLTATWAELEPTDTGGSPILHYAVEHREPEAEWPQTPSASTADAGTLTLDIPNLKNGTEYEVRVYAVNDQGDGNRSEIAAATPATVPDKPNAPTLTARNEQLTATWTAPDNGGNAIIRYEVQYRTSSPQGQWTTSSSADSDVTDTSHTVTGLTNGTTYEVQVRAVNSVAEDAGNGPGVGAWSTSSASATPVDVPKAPTGLALTVGNGKLTASWTAPTDTGGSDITGYAVQYRTGGGAWSAPISAGTSTNHEIPNLKNGTEYEVRVYAVNDQGDGNRSEIAAATPATVPAKPNAPTLTVGDRQLTATWTAPDNGGNAIIRYEVQYRTSSPQGQWTTSSSADSDVTDTSHTVTGLTNGTTYEVQVRAVNSVAEDAGVGAWSTSATETPDVAPTAPTALTLDVGNKRLVVNWAAPSDNGGTPIIRYELEYKLISGSWDTSNDVTQPVIVAGTTTHTIDMLTNGNTYNVRVRAVNGVNNVINEGVWLTSTAMLPASVVDAKAGSSRDEADVSQGTAASVILSANIDVLIADAVNPTITLTPVTTPIPYVPPTPGVPNSGSTNNVTQDATLPTVNARTGLITVTASTTAGTYTVSGEDGSGAEVFPTKYFYVIVSPSTKAALDTAVRTGIEIWGNAADLNYIITTGVTDIHSIFNRGTKTTGGGVATTAFNGDISKWDTTSVTNMSYLFKAAIAFNGDISGWDVSSVENMDSMFNGANAFNGDISGWDVSSVANMSNMFNSALSFKGNLNDWAYNNSVDPAVTWKTTDGGGKWDNGTYTGTKTGMFTFTGTSTAVPGTFTIPTWY